MPTPNTDIRILIIADDVLARAGLAALIGNEPGFKVVGQIDSADKLLANLEIYKPDVLVWDTGGESKPGPQQKGVLSETGLPVLMLVPGQEYAARAWASGARGVLLRSTKASHLTAALRALEQGLIVSAPQLAPPAAPAKERPTADSAIEELTARELEVLRLLAEGLPNKSIAQRLGISEHTVKFHMNSLLSKLNAQSRTEAVMRATRMGLIPL